MTDTLTTVFEQHRDRLFALAYRMLGSAADAEDAVQDAFLRWLRADPAAIDAPQAYLTTVVTRRCIDLLRAARTQREQYIGPWLPEPVVEETPANPAELADSLSMAFLLMLETLSPVERAVFLLRQVFGYDYDAIAPVVGKTVVNCRQIARRARRHLDDRQPRFHAPRDEHERLVRRFIEACRDGAMDALLNVLADDVTLYSDGGGKTHAALKPIYGADKVARFLLGIVRKAPPDLRVEPALVNGEPGFVARRGDEPFSAWSFAVEGGRIRAIYAVVNPEKLQHIA